MSKKIIKFKTFDYLKFPLCLHFCYFVSLNLKSPRQKKCIDHRQGYKYVSAFCMCNVMSESTSNVKLFYICGGFVIEAHLVHSQDLRILVAFGHRLWSSPIHVVLCFLPSIASPSKIA